jgi:hypothetical protein
LQLGVSGSTVQIDTATFGGGAARFRVTASDGVQSSYADSAEFTLSAKAPRPRITAPADATTIYLGQSLNFEGEATDPQLQDGQMPDIAFEWSMPGQLLGTEARISLDDLPLGDNTVTLTTSNTLGMSESVSVLVTVLNPTTLPGANLTAGPQQIGWHVTVGETLQQEASIDVGNSGSGNLQFTAESNAAWLSVNVSSGTAPATLIVAADPSGIPAGATRNAALSLTAIGFPNQSITIPVSLAAGNTFQFPIAEAVAQQQAPAILGGTGTFSVSEDAAVGTILTTIVANDPDGDPLSYAITAGNSAGRFAISGAGILSLAAPLDFESLASYALTVSVSDGINTAVTGSVIIRVTDVQEGGRRKGGGSIDILTILLGSGVWAFSAIFRGRRVRRSQGYRPQA